MVNGVLTVNDVFERVKRTFGDESSAQVTEDDIIRWINDAQREAVMQNEGLIQEIGYVDTVAGTREYNLPEDCFTLEHVWVKDGTSASYYSIKFLAMREFNEQADGWDGANVFAYPLIFTKQSDGKLLLFPAPQTSTIEGLKLMYSAYATPVADSTSQISIPAYLHSYVVNFCLMQAYEMDEDWESAGQKASQIQGDLDFNNNRKFWFSRDAYPSISSNYEDLN